MSVLVAMWALGAQTNRATTLAWDPDGIFTPPLGGSGTWDTTSAFWSNAGTYQAWDNLVANLAEFGGDTGTVNLGEAITAQGLSFKSNYKLTSNVLTLSGGTIRADMGTYSVIDSQLNGTAGLTKSGAGTVKLTNALNNYTGATTINAGTLVIDCNGALGTDVSTVAINGAQTPGSIGGSLVLAGNTGAGNYGTGFIVARNLTMTGGGGGNVVQTSALSGSALISVGNNTISGLLTAAPNSTGIQTGGASGFGALTLSNVSIGGTVITNFTTLGSTGSIGGFNINGTLAGTGSIQKTGFGTLVLNPTDATGFSGTVRVNAGSIRVSSVAALGTNTGTGANSGIDLNGGVFEIRADSFNASTKGVNFRASSTLFFDHAVGTLGAASINGAATFGNLLPTNNLTDTFNSRNGFSMTFNAMTTTPSNANGNVILTNNGSGLVTLIGNVWGQATNSNTLTVNGTGNFQFNTGITATGGAADTVAKAGAGTLTITGTGSTYTGSTTVSAGALTITDFRSLTLASAGTIALGATTVTGTLNIGTSTAATAAGLTSAVNGTTIATSAFSANATTITLASTDGIVVGATISGTGIAAGTTVTNIAGKVVTLSTPATGAGAVNQTITVAGVTTTRVIDLAGTTGGGVINANQTFAAPVILAAATPTTTVISASGAGSKTLTLGGTSTQNNTINGAIVNNSGTNLTSLTKTDSGVWQLAGVNTYTGATTISGGTLKIKANAATSTIIADTSAITFNTNATTLTAGGTLQFTGVATATTEALGALTPTNGAGTIILTTAGAATNLTFASLGTVGKGSGVNFVTTGGGGGTVTVTGVATTTATTLPGNGHLYINGSNFARSNAGVMVAPVYGTDAGFVTSASALTAANNNQITGSFSSAAASITSLKILGSQTLTMTGNLTVNTGAVANDGGILVTGGSAAIGGAGLITTGGGGAVVIRVDGASDVLTLNTNVGSSTTGGLTKNGAGKLVINAVNAQSGTTTINEGTVQLTGTGRLSAPNAALDLRQGAILDLNGLSSGVSIAAFNGAGTVTNSNALSPATLQLYNATTGAGIFSGIIEDGAGVMNVLVTGTTGTPTWSGLNTYTGVTTIGNGGAVTDKLINIPNLANIGVASGIGKGLATDDTTNAASLVFGGVATAGIAYTGTTSVSIDRLFTMNSNQAGAGAQIANNSGNNSALIFSKGNAITFGASAAGVAQTLTLGGSSLGDNQFNLQITNNGATPTSLNKIGAGLWWLTNNANSYTGTTTITQGFLAAQDGTSLPTASGLILGATTTAGVLETSGDFTRSIVASGSAGAGTVSWNASLTTAGSGFSASTGKLRVAFGGIGTETPLVWGNNGFAVSSTATAPLIFNSTTALSELEFRNAIDLNGATRTIQVDDNTTTFTDFATITGVISGSGGVNKTGAGMLQLLGANTYAGSTTVTAGTVVVNSLGDSAVAGGTSVGAATGGNTLAQGVILGNATTTGGALVYVGPGERSDRYIGLTGTANTSQIVADGTGPLVLTNVNNNIAASPTGAKTLQLRGANSFANEITSVLANDGGGGVLSITHDTAGTWILSGANTYTGATTLTSGGSIGAGNDQAFGVGGALTITNSNIFASGGDRTIANPITIGNTTNAIDAYIGDYSLTFNGAVTNGTTSAISRFTRNNIVTGKTLTFNGAYTFNGAVTGTTWNFDGSGDTIINGPITQASSGAASTNVLGINYVGTGSLTLGGTGNAYLGATTITDGTLKLGAGEVIPDGATTGASTTTAASNASTTITAPTAGLYPGMTISGPGIVGTPTITSITSGTAFVASAAQTVASGASLSFSVNRGNVVFNPALGATAKLDLNGMNETVNAINGTAAGTMIIDNSAGTPATLIVGGANASGTFNGSITRSGGSGITLTKTGTGTATFAGPADVTAYNVQSGFLKMTGGQSAPNSVTGITVAGGATLQFFDGVGTPFPNLNTLNLGAGTGTATLELDAGTTSDTLTTSAAAVIANTVRLNIRDVGLSAGGTYPLLVSPSGGLGTLSSYVLGPIGGYSGSTLTVTDNLVQLNLGTPVLGSMYWTGNGNPGPTDQTKWNAVDGTGNGVNFSSTKDGLTLSATVPGAGTTVVFQADSAPASGGQFLATTLEQSFRVNNLVFETSTNTLKSLSIGPGAVSTNRLTIQPAASTDGIKINTGTAQGVLISAQVGVGSAQTWNVADFTSVPLTGGATDFAPTPVPTVTVASTAGLVPGMQINGPGIPTGAYIVSVDSGTQFTMSANATGENAAAQSYTATSALTISGGLTGSGNITKSGSGRVVLSGSGSTYTGTAVNITGGILETQNVTVLGGIAATPNTGATITVNSGTEFRHNSATAGTVANPIVLNGGTLSSGGFTSNATTLALTAINHTYSGNVSVAADSTVQLADLATHATLNHSITLSGAISGTNKITVDAAASLAAGNNIGGTLTINNGTSTWNGPLTLNKGTVVFTNTAGGGNATPYVAYDGTVNFNAFGRIIYRNIDGGLLNRSSAINFAAGAVGELQIDNLSAGLSANYTVNQNGAINLNAGSIVRLNMQDAASTLNINGGIVLNGNASLTSIGGDADSLTSINTIGISGTGDLAINDEFGTWAVTSTRVAINAPGTFSGNTTLNEGTLIIGHKDALSTGSFTVTGASTLQGGTDLSGANAFPNATTLSANLTTSGTNNITFGNTVTQNGGDRTLTNSLTSPAALVMTTLRLAETGAAAARNLTIAGAGATTINTLVNSDQSNTLTNNLTPATLSIGTIALSESAATGRSLTLGGTGNTTVTGVIENVSGGGGLAGGINKTGAGILALQSANTFSGDVTATAGTIEFSTVTNAGGAASNLGQGNNINLAGGTLNFIGSTSQSTNRATPLNASSTLLANGAGGATITFGGVMNGGATSLTLDGSGTGFFNGVLTQTGTANDINKNGSGTWTLGATNLIADDINVNAGVLNINAPQNFLNSATTASNHVVVTGTTAVVNLNAANSFLGDDLFIRSGSVVNLGINGSLARESAARGTDGMRNMLIGDTGTTDMSTLDLKGFTAATGTITIGTDTIPGQIIDSVGGGSINTTGVTVRLGNASGAISGSATFAKNGAGLFTLSGNNTFTGTTTITEGNLLLDYTTNNGSKIAAAAGVTIGGTVTDVNPTLTLNGSATAATTQAFTTLTLSQASSNIVVNSNGGQAANLNFTTITRNAGATVDFTLPTVGAVTTTQPMTNGIIGGYFTVNNGAAFASKDGSNVIQPLAASTKNDVTTWTLADNVTDSGAGFTGTATGITGVNSITYSGAAAAAASAGIIGLNSGGILVTSTSTGSSLTGGTITSGLFDVVVHQYAAGDYTLGAGIRGINAITKTGSGTLVLSGANTSNGAVNITEGLISASGGKAIGDAATIGFKDVAGSGLQLLASETVGNISGGGTTGGNIALGNNTLTINATASSTFAGVITGGATSGIVRNGTSGVGNLLLTGASGAGFTGTVTINGGLLYLEGLGSLNASSITVNKGGSFLISNNGTTRTATRLPDTATITLNSADGAWNNETRPSGLAVRTEQAATTSETIGALVFASGASYFRGDASGTTGIAGILASSFIRTNNATLDARGRALGGASGDRNQLRIVDATSQTAFLTTLVGGGGAAGTKNISIVPWAFGESTSATLADANMGNSLVTYVSGAGIRPLDLVTEYNTFGGTPTATDNIRESLAADLTGLAGTTINSLVINNSNTAAGTVNVTGTGAGQTLAVTSGTMLFTATAAVTGTPAMGITLGGFDSGIAVGSTNEYVVFVQNPTSAAAGGTVTATISSSLTSTADITKSGRGVLVLSGTNTAGGGTKKTTINEGILEISALANIGGATGNLVFAGGTLRLGTTLVDDISSRTISFLQGGGAIDTNGIDYTVANSIGAGSIGSFTKTGTGNLRLNAPMTHTGGTTINNGTLTAGVANMFPATSNLTVNSSSATLELGSFNQTVGTFTLANGAVVGSATLTASDFQLQSGTDASTVVFAGANASVGITKTTAGTVGLGGAHTFTGPVVIQAGFLSVSQISDPNGTPSSLGAQTNAIDGTLQIGLGANAAGITYTGAGQTANRQIALTGTTGTAAIAASGTGALDWAGAVTSVEFGQKALVLRGTSASGIVNKLTAGITEVLGTVGIQKLDTNVWQIDTASNYSGPTQIDEGTLRIGGSNILPATTAVRLGNGTTAGVFDLNGFNQTIGSLTSSTNSNTAANQILIAAGKTLTINGAVTLGANAAASTTIVTATGGGDIVVNNSGGTFQVGGATGGTNANTATVDFSGLANFTASLGATGTFRLGDVTTGTAAAPSILILATNNSITAGSIRIGDSSGPSSVNTLTLGSGTNTLNADLINIGSAGSGIRSSGLVNFLAGDATGSVTIRAADGTSGATLNMVNTTGNTAGNIDGSINLAGHTADLKFTSVNMAIRSTNTGAASATLTFDQGTMEITTLALASRTGTGTGSANGVVNLGDSSAPGSPTTNIGSMAMAVNTSAGGPVTADFNVTGGNVNIGAINMANAAASRTATATIDLTGGTTTVTGNITRTGGAGTESATLTVDGGTLDMTGKNIGSNTAAVSLVAASGTLKNLGELNGGGAFTKTTTGTLTLEGVNTYTGNTTVSAGTLVVNNSSGSGTGTGSVTVDLGTTLAGNGSIAPASGKSITLNGTTVIGTPGSSNAEDFVMTVTGAANIALNGTMRIDLFNNLNTGVLNGPTANDVLAVNAADWSALVFGGSSILKIDSILPSNGYVQGDAWKIFDWSGILAGTVPSIGSGGFATVDLPVLDSGFSWNTTQLYSQGVISIDVVPEPGRALLALFGLLALAFRRRRKA